MYPPGKPDAYVQLGRYGDVISLLPLLYQVSDLYGGRTPLVISRDFADVLQGVSYVEPLIFDSDRDDLGKALNWARQFGRHIVNTQCVGDGVPTIRRTESFIRDSWHMAGKDHRWDQNALVFDRRHHAWEADLIKRASEIYNFGADPLVLVNRNSSSSPFLYDDELTAALTELTAHFQIVDISNLKAERIYDLLGLMDIALCMITVDTSVLHLAAATSMPVISLVNPKPWYGSLPGANHVYHATYDNFTVEGIIEAVWGCVPRSRKYLHLVPFWHEMDDPTQERYSMARASYHALSSRWDHQLNLPERDSRSVGDDRALPFVRDMIEYGLARVENDDDVLVITNTDVGFTPDIERYLAPLMNRGAVFGYRFNFERIDHPLTREETLRGMWDGGVDLFAFTRGFWKEHQHEFPDMIMGAPFWDLLYRDTIKRLGGGELYGCIWHQTHPSVWKSDHRLKANLHNQRLYIQYMQENDRTRPYHQRWGLLTRRQQIHQRALDKQASSLRGR